MTASTTFYCCLSFILISFLLQSLPALPLENRALKQCYQRAAFTFYWIPKEGDPDMLNNGKTIHLTGPKTKTLVDSRGQPIAKVSKTTYEKFQMEGTGLLQNGMMVNLGMTKNKFEKVNRKADPFGIGSNENPLAPWVSVASNDLKRGTRLYIKELDQVRLPDGQVHNGCVRVDDEGWSFGKCQLDFFILQYSAFKTLSTQLPEHVTAVEQDCQVLDYVTAEVKKWAVLRKKRSII